LGGIDVGPLVSAVENAEVTTGQQIPAKDVLAAVPDLPVLDTITERVGARSEGQRAAALELALEALYLAKKIDKNSEDGETVYG
jgi:magnesium chelatase subunit I